MDEDDLTVWPPARLQKALDKSEANRSRINQSLIDAGFGNTKPNELRGMDHPLAKEYVDAWKTHDRLRDERERRMTFHGSLRRTKPDKAFTGRAVGGAAKKRADRWH